MFESCFLPPLNNPYNRAPAAAIAAPHLPYFLACCHLKSLNNAFVASSAFSSNLPSLPILANILFFLAIT